eukprot:620890-Amphidinium_carterae.1
MVTKKGSSPYSVELLVQMVKFLGCTHVTLKSDHEESAEEIKRKAAHVLMIGGYEVHLEHSPAGDSASNGEAEATVRSVKGLTRTLLHAYHAVVSWAVKHAASMLNRYHKAHGNTGFTAWQMVKGRAFKDAGIAFGSKVLFQRLGKRRSTLADRWEVGVYLGLVDDSTEVIIGTAEGVVRGRAARPCTDGDRAARELVEGIKHYPWKLDGELSVTRDVPAAIHVP